MDYVVGSIAALISGNVTPNRPKLTKRALTPTKHMPSPNVTPKSEFVEDRSVFLSPSVQKKKAIVKKSPKRIFQNPDLDVTNDDEGNTSTSSPKADKVKKHLKGELEANMSPKKSKAANTPEKKQGKSLQSPSPNKNVTKGNLKSSAVGNVSGNELTPKKKKKQRNSISDIGQSVEETVEVNEGTPKKAKNDKNINKENIKDDTQIASTDLDVSHNSSKKKKNKNKLQTIDTEVIDNLDDELETETKETETTSPKKKNKKRKKTKTDEPSEENDAESKPTKNKKVKVNPNAITDKDSDSEHDSDDEIESETEETNKEVLENSVEAEEQSSDEEETPAPKKKDKKEKVETQETEVKEVNTEEEIKRTLFVGNVPFSKKCKKEIKKIFNKYGQIESVRIRTVPVKDASVTPKLAVIKQELHPERSTVNVYVKFSDPQCVEAALAENNTVLSNNHLRVTRSGSTGAEHDPRHSVFVGNIPFALEDEGLREKFQGCGEIESVRIVRDKKTNAGKVYTLASPSLFIGNIPFALEDAGLREKFQACGEIESVRIVRDKKTNAGKGFGYVNFTSRDGVELALALTDEDLTIKNRIMRVKRCTQVAQRAQRGRGGPSRPGFQGRKPSQGDRQRNQPPSRPQRGGFNSRGGFQGRGRGGGSRGGAGDRGGGSRGGAGGRGGQSRGRFQGNREERPSGELQDGAHRRLANKRKSQEGTEGSPTKKPRSDEPPREKKTKKEFVGMTAEKKKKRKVDKGQKKKKALSEILTKYNSK